jgi:hypothetical protein
MAMEMAMATQNEQNENTILFNPSVPFDPSTVYYKPLIYTKAAAAKNRLIIQQNYKFKEDDICPICIDSMWGKSVIYTPCKHKFHSKCFFMLLSSGGDSKYKCPLCRHELMFALLKLYGSLRFTGINTIIDVINSIDPDIIIIETEIISDNDEDEVESENEGENEGEGEGDTAGEVENDAAGEHEDEGEGEDEDDTEHESEDEDEVVVVI